MDERRMDHLREQSAQQAAQQLDIEIIPAATENDSCIRWYYF